MDGPRAALEPLFAAADAALYRAKGAGRDRVEVARHDPVALAELDPPPRARRLPSAGTGATRSGMLDQLLAPENAVFSAALLLMLLIGAVQALGVVGDVDGADVGDHDGDIGAAEALLAWAGIGRVPFLMWLVVFLAFFGGIGLGLQQLLTALTGGPGSNLLAVPVTAVAALPPTGTAARVIARVFPGIETTAIDRDELIGTRATITVGTASPGSPAPAKCIDRHGQPHQIMVEPDSPGQSFQTGETVLLVGREGETFKGFSNGDFYLPRLD